MIRNLNRQEKFKIAVVKRNGNNLTIVKERNNNTLEGIRQYNEITQSLCDSVRNFEFYSNRNMYKPYDSTCSQYGNQNCGPNFSPLYTQIQHDYYNGPSYYQHGHSQSNFSPSVDNHTYYFNEYQNKPNVYYNSQCHYSEGHYYQEHYNCYAPTSVISSNQNYYCDPYGKTSRQSQNIITISSTFQQRSHQEHLEKNYKCTPTKRQDHFLKELSIDKKQSDCNRLNYQKKCPSTNIQVREKVDQIQKIKIISQTQTSSTKDKPIKCEILNLCKEETSENVTETDSKEGCTCIKGKENSEKNAPHKQYNNHMNKEGLKNYCDEVSSINVTDLTKLPNEQKSLTESCQKNVTKNKICSDCKEIYPCNAQQNCEQDFNATQKPRNGNNLENNNETVRTNESCDIKSIEQNIKTNKFNLLSMNKKLLDLSNNLKRKKKMDSYQPSKFRKAPKDDGSDSGSNIFNKETKYLCKENTFNSKQKTIDASYKIPKLSKCNIDNSESTKSTILSCNNNENNVSKEKTNNVIGNVINSTDKIDEAQVSSTFKKVKERSENFSVNKKFSIGNFSNHVETITNKNTQLKCKRISHKKRDVNVIREVNSIKIKNESAIVPKNLKNTKQKETSTDKTSISNKVSNRIETKHYGTNKSLHCRGIDERKARPKGNKEKISVENRYWPVSKINEAGNTRKLTESFKHDKKYKAETAKITSKAKRTIAKTCNEQFNKLKSVVHVAQNKTNLDMKKQNKLNSSHKTARKNEKFSSKEAGNDLLITADKEKNVKGKITKHCKNKVNLNIIINFKYPQKSSTQKRIKKDTDPVEDLSFLDDFDVDEIVESLNSC